MGSRARKSAGWADYVPLWLVLCGVGTALVLTVLGVVHSPQRAVTMWDYSTAEPCPQRAPAADCLATLPGRIVTRIDSGGGPSSTPTAVIHLAIPDAPPGTDYFHGTVLVQLSPTEADDLGITGDEQDVTVTLFAGDAVSITGPNGRTETAEDPPPADFLGSFVLLVASALATMISGVYLWRRIRLHGWRSRLPSPGLEPQVPMPHWVRRAAGCAGAGTVAGVLLGLLSGLVFAYALVVPVTLGGTVAAGALLAWYTARRAARVSLS